MKKSLALLLTILLVILTSSLCSAEMAVQSNGLQGNSVQADGYGTAKATANPAQATIMARRAAIVDAYRNLLENIQGVQIDATTTVQDAMTTSDTIYTKVTGFLKGAKVVQESWTPEGAYHVVVSVALYGQTSLAAIMEPTIRANAPAVGSYAPISPGITVPPAITPVPTTPLPVTPIPITPAPVVGQRSATGLILDCRNTSLERTMAPVIYDEDGRVIYSSTIISYDVLINKGLCDYVVQSSTDYSRAGNAPLTITPMALRDFNRNFVVSRADGARILAANDQSNMLAQAAVVVLIN
ncbi:MAG: LPP20 family lipoprotein [Bacillota bacterium]